MVYNIILEKTNNWVSQMDGSIYSFPGNFILNLIISLCSMTVKPLLICSYLVLKLFSPKKPHNYLSNVPSRFVCSICITYQGSASRVATGCAETDISWADLSCMIQQGSVCIFFVPSNLSFIWDAKFCSLAAHETQSSWKRQKAHFHNLPHSPDYLAKILLFTMSLRMKMENTRAV